jgi:hypothetical protein
MKYYTELQEYRKLDDVCLPDDDIDPKVQGLVLGLTSIGVDTHASCEGHLDRSHHHPWVGFNPFSYAKIGALEYLVKEYNHTHDIKWEVDMNWLRPTMSKGFLCCIGKKRISEKELKRLQGSADGLGRFIFYHRKDKKIRELLLIYGW